MLQKRAGYVEMKDGSRLPTELMRNRLRHRILRVKTADRVAKVVKGSGKFRRREWDTSEEARCLLLRNRAEWRFLRKQTHPGLVRVYDRVVDEHGDEGYLCEPLMEHRTKDGPHPFSVSLGAWLTSGSFLAQAASVLHAHKLVHGDITPSNVPRRGTKPVLIDFENSVKVGQRLTQNPGGHEDSLIIATPSCCSPEQTKGEPVTPTSDVFCIGLTMLSWVSGFHGMDGSMPNQSADDLFTLCHLAQYPHWEMVEERVRNTEALAAVKLALSRDPEERYQDGTQMSLVLEGVMRRLSDAEFNRPLRTT
ncbi:hypothetical protein HY630_03085 [Candidatus Uhrbacteria bacterium]|nr:hypothetical protein [Candidatus Uhrbacteria bacterium]